MEKESTIDVETTAAVDMEEKSTDHTKTTNTADIEKKSPTNKASSRPRSCQVLAEELHRLSLESKRKPSVVFDLGKNVAESDDRTSKRRRELTYWLQENLPSKLHSVETLAIFSMRRKDEDLTNYDNRVERYTRTHEAWTKLLSNELTEDFTYKSMWNFATNQNVTGGKWMLIVKKCQVDSIWLKISWAMELSQVSENCVLAKVSAMSEAEESYVIELWNRNFLDEEAVLAVEKSVRNLGIRLSLKYKPDLFTAVGIYRNNQYGLRPVIYSSVYPKGRNTTEIESTVDQTWKIEPPKPEKAQAQA